MVTDYSVGDEIYLIGFSRGAYAAPALGGLIGASGIQRATDATTFEIAWQHYRVRPAARAHPKTASSSERTAIADYAGAGSAFHDTRTVKCVAVWDTVGSYGIPLDSRAKCNRALREPDLHVFAKLFEDYLKRSS